MIEKGLYYLKREYGDLVKRLGGTFDDTKHRPVVCLIKSSENPDLYWAIPMGNLHHSAKKQIERLKMYLNFNQKDIRSCYYHIGRTTNDSIFFISDAIPVIDTFISDIHVGPDNKQFIIKNPNLISELERKLKRILAMENSKPNFYRQHITVIKNYLLNELNYRSRKKSHLI